MFVLVRSRPARNTGAAASAARSCPCVSGSSSTAASTPGIAASRAAAMASWWRRGAWSSSASRIRSMAASGRLGIGLPRRRARLPLVRTARAELVQELVEGAEERLGVGVVGALAAGRAGPSTPASNAAVSDADAAHHAAQLPERVRRRRRVHAADAGDQRHRERGIADGGAHALDHAEGHRGAVRDVEVLGEHPAQLGRVAPEPGDQLGVGHRRRSRGGSARSSAIRRWSASRSVSSGAEKIQPSVAWIASVFDGSSSPGIDW